MKTMTLEIGLRRVKQFAIGFAIGFGTITIGGIALSMVSPQPPKPMTCEVPLKTVDAASAVGSPTLTITCDGKPFVVKVTYN
jgi:hypothetical protein